MSFSELIFSLGVGEMNGQSLWDSAGNSDPNEGVSFCSLILILQRLHSKLFAGLAGVTHRCIKQRTTETKFKCRLMVILQALILYLRRYLSDTFQCDLTIFVCGTYETD